MTVEFPCVKMQKRTTESTLNVSGLFEEILVVLILYGNIARYFLGIVLVLASVTATWDILLICKHFTYILHWRVPSYSWILLFPFYQQFCPYCQKKHPHFETCRPAILMQAYLAQTTTRIKCLNSSHDLVGIILSENYSGTYQWWWHILPNLWCELWAELFHFSQYMKVKLKCLLWLALDIFCAYICCDRQIIAQFIYR
jgi:hypothetical protein